MVERLGYALVGAVLGAVAGAILWWLYGVAFHSAIMRPSFPGPLAPVVKVSSVICALVGFVAKDRVGDFIGGILNTVFRMEVGNQPDAHLPGWLVIAVLLVVGISVWYLL